MPYAVHHTICSIECETAGAPDCNEIPVICCRRGWSPTTGTSEQKAKRFTRDTFQITSTENRNNIKMRRDVTIFPLSVFELRASYGSVAQSHNALAKHEVNFVQNSWRWSTVVSVKIHNYFTHCCMHSYSLDARCDKNCTPIFLSSG